MFDVIVVNLVDCHADLFGCSSDMRKIDVVAGSENLVGPLVIPRPSLAPKHKSVSNG